MVSETPCGWNRIFINLATQRFTASLDLFFLFPLDSKLVYN